jgi:hypothetical protein
MQANSRQGLTGLNPRRFGDNALAVMKIGYFGSPRGRALLAADGHQPGEWRAPVSGRAAYSDTDSTRCQGDHP